MNGLHAIILAAGKGERLAPLTEKTNKVLADIGGQAMIGHMLAALAAAEVETVTIVTGHCAAQVEARLGERFDRLPIRYLYNPRYATANNIVSLAAGLEALPRGSSLLLIEGDVMLDPELLRRMVAAGDRNAALVAPWRPGLDGTLAAASGGTITELIMGDRLAAITDRRSLFKTVNVTRLCAETLDAAIRPALAARIAGGGETDFYEAVFAEAIVGGTLQLDAILTDDHAWVEVDDGQDLDRARFLFAPDNRREILDRAYGGYWNYPVLDFAYPRNFHFPTPAINEELAALLPSIVGSYGSSQALLDKKLARFVGCPADEIVCINGLSQIFPWLSIQFDAEKVLMPDPSFGEYMRTWPDALTYADKGAIDVGELRGSASAASVIVIVNPNNPTGTFIDSAEIAALAHSESGKTFIVDESFMDFADRPSLVEACGGTLPSNVLLLKSLGKTLGASGLRLGYVRSRNPDIVRDIRQALPIWNCNALAEAFLEILPKHRRSIANALARTREDCEALRQSLAHLPIVAEILPGAANFLMVRLDIPAERRAALLDGLVERFGIYVKDISERVDPAETWLRLSARPEGDIEKLCEALTGASSLPAAISPAIQR